MHYFFNLKLLIYIIHFNINCQFILTYFLPFNTIIFIIKQNRNSESKCTKKYGSAFLISYIYAVFNHLQVLLLFDHA